MLVIFSFKDVQIILFPKQTFEDSWPVVMLEKVNTKQIQNLRKFS